MCCTGPAPTTVYREENAGELLDESGLLLGIQHEVAVAFRGVGKGGEDAATNTKIGAAHVRAFLGAREAKRYTAKVLGIQGGLLKIAASRLLGSGFQVYGRERGNFSASSGVLESGTEMANTRSGGLMAIAIYKFVKTAGLLLLGFGALHFLHHDLASTVAHWVDLLRIDPHSKNLLWLMEKVSKVDEKKLHELSIGTFSYAALFFCEGVGLAMKKRWAEYLTIASTASLMPIEIFEIYKHATGGKIFLLVVNALIVAYLVVELRRSVAPKAARRKGRTAARAEA